MPGCSTNSIEMTSRTNGGDEDTATMQPVDPGLQPPAGDEREHQRDEGGAQMSSSTSPTVSATPASICLSSSETSSPKPVAVISGPLRLSGRRRHATRPNAANDPPTRRYTTSAPATGSSPKMIGTSAPNSAATASVHIATQNPALRPGALKRRDASTPGWAPADDASPLATTALGAQRLLTRWLLTGLGGMCPQPEGSL